MSSLLAIWNFFGPIVIGVALAYLIKGIVVDLWKSNRRP